MDGESGAELRLEPGRFRRHDIARIGNIDQLLHGNRIEGKGNFHLAAVNPAGKFSESTDPTDEINSFVRTEILDPEQFIQYKIGKDRYIENADRVVVVIPSGLRLEAIPFVSEIHREIVQSCRGIRLGRTAAAGFRFHFNIKVSLQGLKELLRCHSVQILDNPVIINDRQLAFRETDSHEIIIFFLSGMIRVLSAFLGPDPGGGSRTVV